MPEPMYRIDAESAYVVDGWSPAARAELERHCPPRIELVGLEHDLAPIARIAEHVRSLAIRGAISNGRIASVSGLSSLHRLEALVVAARVKRGLELDSLHELRRCEVFWQPETVGVFELPALEHAIVHAFREEAGIRPAASASFTALRLDSPSIPSLQPIAGLSGLHSLKIVRGRSLTTLDGIEHLPLRQLDIHDAHSLTDLAALSRAPALQLLRLMHVGLPALPASVYHLPALEELHVGGRNAPFIDWRQVISMPAIRKISGEWDPEQVTESDIRHGVPAGRSITRFDPVGTRGRRALIIEFADGQR